MALETDLEQHLISQLVKEEGNVAGQPGGGPLATNIPLERSRRFRASSRATADAAGDATVEFAGPTTGYCWLVERMTVEGGGTASVYVGEVTPAGLVDFTPSGTADVADNNSPVYVPGGQRFTVVFTGAGAGTECTVNIQVRLAKEG